MSYIEIQMGLVILNLAMVGYNFWLLHVVNKNRRELEERIRTAQALLDRLRDLSQ